MAEKKVRLQITTQIMDQETESQFDLTLFGTTAVVGNVRYLRYTELVENGEVKNILKYDGNDLTIIRKGVIHFRQLFSIGKETSAIMKSAMGEMHFTTNTHKIASEEKDGELTFSFEYDLSAQFEPIGRYKLTVKAVDVV